MYYSANEIIIIHYSLHKLQRDLHDMVMHRCHVYDILLQYIVQSVLCLCLYTKLIHSILTIIILLLYYICIKQELDIKF